MRFIYQALKLTDIQTSSVSKKTGPSELRGVPAFLWRKALDARASDLPQIHRGRGTKRTAKSVVIIY